MGKKLSPTRIFTKQQVNNLLNATIGKTLLEVDYAELFKLYEGKTKVTGIAGEIIEISVLGCEMDNRQDPDIIVDNIKTELKTTGMIKPKKQQSPYLFECKEPVSVTAVSIDKIVNENFENSNFWHKLEHILWVYYWYNSNVTVKLEGYKNFKIIGFQFYEFNNSDRLTLRQDWLIVRDFLIDIHNNFKTEDERKKQYPRLSHELRSQLMLIDTAPKYPNPPRFRLKRAFATVIADRYFKNRHYEHLSQPITKYSEIDEKCKIMNEKYKDKTFKEIASILGTELTQTKNFAETLVIKMFGSDAKSLNSIEDFAKIGLMAKCVPLRENGSIKEDTKLFMPNLLEWIDESTFENSALYSFFAERQFILIIYQHIGREVVFKKIKRVFFNEEMIFQSVKPLWDQVRYLITSKKLKIVRKLNQDGSEKRNKSGTVQESPNFPKSANFDTFLRGSATKTEDKYKTLCINGLKMLPQYVWLSRRIIKKFID